MARSARPLSAIAKAGIKQRVKQVYPNAKRITISEQIDPGVLGGARLSLPGQQLDLSVEAKMNQLRQLTTGKD
jgi:F0F1-type ATP synthase delta subunit